MKKKTLGFKLVAGGIAAVLIPLLVVGLFAVNKASDALTQASQSRALDIATDGQSCFPHFIGDRAIFFNGPADRRPTD